MFLFCYFAAISSQDEGVYTGTFTAEELAIMPQVRDDRGIPMKPLESGYLLFSQVRVKARSKCCSLHLRFYQEIYLTNLSTIRRQF